MATTANYHQKQTRASLFHENDFHSPTTTSSFTYSGFKAFDIEVDMARALITADPNARPKHFRNVFEEVVFVFTVMMATACTTFIQGVVNINTATIGRDLIMTPAEITWIAAAIGLASGSFMLFFGKTADLFGRKIQIVAGLAFLALCSLITAFAPTPTAFNILCGFLGLGTAIIAPPAIGLLFATYPEGRRRNRVTGALGAGNPIGFLLGSLSSGTATKYANWRASFFVLAAFFLVMTAMAIWTMPAIPRSGNASALVKQFDYLGTVLVAVGMSLISASLTQGPELGWKSPKVISLLLLGLLLILTFVFWQTIYPYPLLNPSIWKNTNFTLCILCVGFGYMSFITNQFWIMLFMQDIQMIPSLLIAVRLLPQTFAGIVWSYLGQVLVSKWSGRVVMGIGGVAYVLGATLVIFIRAGTGYWVLLFPALCVTVVGADFQFIVANLYISRAMPTQSSLGAGVLQTAMRLSISIGLSITSAAYGSAASTTAGKENRTLPYERAYLCSIIFAVLGLSFVPFMKIGRQGKKSPSPSLHENTSEVSRIVSGLSRFNSWSGLDNDSSIASLEPKSSLRYKPTSVSVNVNRMSVATIRSGFSVESAESWEPRWSAEAEEDRFIAKDEMMVYEMCTKCMEERRSFMPILREDVNAWDVLGSVGGGGNTRQLSNYRHTWSGDGRFANSGLGPMSPLVVRDVRMGGFGVREREWI